MANVIDDDSDIFDAYTYGTMSRKNLTFLREASSRTNEVLSDVGRRFVSKIRDTIELYDIDRISRGVRAIRDRMTDRWVDDDVRILLTQKDLQQAKSKMSRWLAANPRVRRERMADRVVGWRDNYIDYDYEAIGERHRDYRIVMNGIGVTDEETGETCFTRYLDVIDEFGETELSFSEQVAVLMSWDATNDLMDANYSDPTDPKNGFM